MEEIPTGRRNDETTCDLHDKKRDAEEGENFAAKERRGQEKREAVGRDLARQDLLSGLGVVPGEAEKDRGIAHRVHNWEQRREGNAEGLEKVNRVEFHWISDFLFEHRTCGH